ncbi:MAG: NADH-quinone oxidoreductase subunit L [Phycisphaerae bacterium]
MLAEASTPLLPVDLYATVPFWPLLGAIVTGVLIALRAKPGQAHWPVVLGCLVSAVLAVILFFDLPSALRHEGGTHGGGQGRPASQFQQSGGGAEEQAAELFAMFTGGDLGSGEGATSRESHDPGFTHTVYNWISYGEQQSLDPKSNQWISVNFYFDGLTGIMTAFVTVVSLMVVIYSIGYMRDHHGHPQRGYERFFAFMGIFVFSMATLVYAGNFILLYLGWELVGLCSYLLISFYYKRPSAAAAAKKAFIVNRVGDFGFALGVFSLYLFINPLTQPGENPLDYEVVFHYVGQLSQGQITLIALLLMCGALGKSAQFPLYVWLPDAMEGPTPVSALIHAATMVTAGIYMIARCGPIFAASETALAVIVILGVIGAVLAATMATAQYDMKRILAYSTISQLAYMFVALGCSAPASGVFHVFTHAFFKALLFLCAGSVMHAMGNVIDLRHFSGLGNILPKTRNLMLIGCLALAGFPLLAGFWSKDEIVHASFEYHPVVGVIMLVTAGLTAYYTFRMYFLCFHGPTRLPEEAGAHPHESPPVMIRPLYLLAVGSIFAGYLGVRGTMLMGDSFLGFLKPHGYFHRYLHDSTLVGGEQHGGGIWLMYVSAAIAIAGIWLAWVRYVEAPAADPDKAALGGLWKLWNAKYYVDEIYDRLFVRPLRRLGQFFFATDNNGIDGLIWVVCAVPRGLGAGLRLVQLGALQGYALGMVIGLVALLLLWRWVEAGA